jgi:hypothetical protein
MEEYEKAMEGHPSDHVEYEDGVLYYKGRLFIPDSLELKKSIVESEHDSRVAGHMGADKTVEIGECLDTHDCQTSHVFMRTVRSLPTHRWLRTLNYMCTGILRMHPASAS